MRRQWLIVPAAALILTGCGKATSEPAPSGVAGASCQVRGLLPDPTCSPGLATTDAKSAICTSGYATKHRDVPLAEWDSIFTEYGVTKHSAATYEIDHIIPLELGGSNDPKNLFPESAPGYHAKDVLENTLHADVCDGSVSLAAAQHAIATDWTAAYRTYVGGNP